MQTNMQLHADTYHMNIEEENFYKPLVACGDVLGYIHMSESHRGQIGTGTVNWEQVFLGLKDANYQGPLVLEVLFGEQPGADCRHPYVATTEADSETLAREGLKFLRDWSTKVGL